MLKALFLLSNLEGCGVVKSGLFVGDRAVGVRLELDEGESCSLSGVVILVSREVDAESVEGRGVDIDLLAETGVPIPAPDGLPMDLLFAAGVDRPSSLTRKHYDGLQAVSRRLTIRRSRLEQETCAEHFAVEQQVCQLPT